MTRFANACLLVVLASPMADARDVVEKPDIPYVADAATDAHLSERCRVDLYLPEREGEPFPILVWFHGGGLEAALEMRRGTSDLPAGLRPRESAWPWPD